MSEVPPTAAEGEPTDASHEELETKTGEGGQVGGADPAPGQQGSPGHPGEPQQQPAPAEWWRIDQEPSAPAAPSTPPSGTPQAAMPPWGTLAPGQAGSAGAPPWGTPALPQPGASGTPPWGTPPWGTPPPGSAPWSTPGWGAPPWAGAPQWYGWGAGSPGGPPQAPPGGGPGSPASPRRRSIPWVVVGAVLAVFALLGLGVGIGFIVWGGASAPAVSRHRAVAPFSPGFPSSPVSPFTGTSRGGFLGVKIATTSSITKTTGAHVEGVVASSPAAKAGIAKGDTITRFDTQAVTSARTLAVDVEREPSGSRAKVEWVTSTGKHESATVTLTTRPTSSLG